MELKEKLVEFKKKVKDHTPEILITASTAVAITAVAVALHYRNRLVELESDDAYYVEIPDNMVPSLRTEEGLTIRETIDKGRNYRTFVAEE